MDGCQFIEDTENLASSLVMLLRMDDGAKVKRLENLPRATHSPVFGGTFSLSTLKRMHLSTQAIEEFKEICRDEFGVELSDDEAGQHALRILNLFWLVLTDDEPEAPSAHIGAFEGGDVA